MIDVTEHINAVRRTVGTRTLEAGEARVVTITRGYDAPIEDVWDACTSAERIPRWFLPVTGELRLGGRYQLVGNAGGTVESCDPPKRFAATWEFDDQVSRIELRLTPEAEGRTRFELDHIVPADEHWERFGPGAVGIGWDMILLGLGIYLTSGAGVDPAESTEWAASADGRRFMTVSAESWCEADIADGADEAVARAAAERTVAAYTGS